MPQDTCHCDRLEPDSLPVKEIACGAGSLEISKGLKGLPEKAVCGLSRGFVILKGLGKPITT